MVGLPTAGVLGVLQAGRGLRAPHAVGGEWRISAGPLADSTLVVQQSGEHLSVVLPGGRRLTGKLRGDSIDVAAAPGTTLRARVDASATPRRMTGVVASGGASPAPIEAVHAPKAEAAKGGH